MKALNIAWKHMRRSPYQAMAAIITMFLTFLLGGIFFLASTASVIIIQYFESKPQITVFFKDDVADRDVEGLKSALVGTGKTTSITYVSKDEALKIYREQNKKDPLLLEMVTADILPASLEVSASDPKYLGELEPIIGRATGVEEVVYQKDVVDTLLRWTSAIRWAGGVLGGLLALDSLLILVTIIGMKIALRREEVEVLKLVGASPWYIRFPFVLEGALYGVIGATLSWVTITGVTLYIREFILGFLGMIPSIHALFTDITSSVFILSALGFWAALVAVGFLLGSFGSSLAVGRYLKF